MTAATADRLYDGAYAASILADCVKRLEASHPVETFEDALKGRADCIQRPYDGGQQVFDTKARINIELRDRMAVIYLPHPDSREVGDAAAAALGRLTGGVFEMTDQGDADGMTDARSARSRAAGSIYEYVLGVWRAPVPGPSKGTPDRDGCHLMLSVNLMTAGA